MSGRRGTAPCGHPGTHIVGNYVQCDRGCDRVTAVPETIEREDTDRIPCPHHDVGWSHGTLKCWDCGARGLHILDSADDDGG